MSRKWKLAAIGLVAYVGTYIVLSRRGMAEARANGHGLYYLTPVDTATWHNVNGACRAFFEPLNCIDVKLGTGIPAGSDPMWKLS